MTNVETKVTHIEIAIDSPVWLTLKHVIREAGYKWYLQPNLFEHSHVSLFLERRHEEPEGGQLKQGFLVYSGGATISSPIQEVYEAEIGKS